VFFSALASEKVDKLHERFAEMKDLAGADRKLRRWTRRM
jgi:hypothetical protein